MTFWPIDANGAAVFTADTTGAKWINGFLRRSSDGAIVATTTTAGSALRGGFLRRISDGALVYSTGAMATIRNAFARDAAGALATVAADPTPPYKQHGLKYSTTKQPFVSVIA